MVEQENAEQSGGGEPSFQVDDRVRRKDIESCVGTVTALRTEVTASSGSTDEKAVMVIVQWDNGTQSYFTPNNLERA